MSPLMSDWVLIWPLGTALGFYLVQIQNISVFSDNGRSSKLSKVLILLFLQKEREPSQLSPSFVIWQHLSPQTAAATQTHRRPPPSEHQGFKTPHLVPQSLIHTTPAPVLISPAPQLLQPGQSSSCGYEKKGSRTDLQRSVKVKSSVQYVGGNFPQRTKKLQE